VSSDDAPRTWRAVAGTLLVAVVWALLAARRPDRTYHFAPALVVWAYPYLRLSGAETGRRQALGWVAVGGAVAVGVALALHAMDWLQGPVLFGGDALREAVLVTGLAALAGVVVASLRTGRRE
jgi:hypothetical protein